MPKMIVSGQFFGCNLLVMRTATWFALSCDMLLDKLELAAALAFYRDFRWTSDGAEEVLVL